MGMPHPQSVQQKAAEDVTYVLTLSLAERQRGFLQGFSHGINAPIHRCVDF